MTQAEYEAEVERRQRVVDEAGLSRCEWLAARKTVSAQPGAGALMRLANEVKAHSATCPTCKARNEYARANFGPMPARPRPPEGPRGFVLPAWSRPPVFGATAIGAIVALRVIGASLGPRGMPIGIGLAAIGFGMACGAAGGLVLSATRPALRKLGALGDYLSGVVAMGGYIGAALLMLSALGSKPVIKNGSDAVIFAVIIVGFGLLGAHSWRRKNRTPS